MDINEIGKSFLFHVSDGNLEHFFCPCGEHFSEKKIQTKADGKMIESEVHVMNIDSNSFKKFDVDEFFSNVDLDIDATCPSCKKTSSSYSKQGLKIKANTRFYKKFLFKETSEQIILYKILYEGSYYDDLTQQNGGYYNKKRFEIIEDVESIFIDKETKEIGLQKGDKKIYLDLENLFDSVQEFFDSKNEKANIKFVDNFLDIHIFIGRLANLKRDTKNINLVDGLLDEIGGSKGLSLSQGVSSLIKVCCILLAITKHENLSTIAMTKGGLFLFELLKDCELPKASVLKDLGLTKPIQIFNYLINLEAKKIQEKIDKSDKEKQKYAFKSVKLQSGEEIKISFNENDDFYSTAKIKKEADGTMTVKEGLENKKISPFFFKKIKTVAEYKSLIRYCKFVDYNELLNIIMKYDSVFLINLFNFIEYRNDITIDSINYFINLYGDFFAKKDFDYYEKEFKDYLIYFDDSKRILVSLKWNVKRELMTIKKCSELEKYHNWLVKQYNNTVEKKESKIQYQNFVEKYKIIEDYVNPDIEIKLIDTVEGLLFWAKQLKNSAAEYAINVERGVYLMAIVNYKTFKNDENIGNLKNFMLGLNVDKRGMLEFDQFKSTANQLASNKLKLILMDYLREKDISYRELEDLSLVEDKKSKAKQAEFMYNDNLSIENVNVESGNVYVENEDGTIQYIKD